MPDSADFVNKNQNFIKCQTSLMSVRFETGDVVIFPGLYSDVPVETFILVRISVNVFENSNNYHQTVRCRAHGEQTRIRIYGHGTTKLLIAASGF